MVGGAGARLCDGLHEKLKNGESGSVRARAVPYGG